MKIQKGLKAFLMCFFIFSLLLSTAAVAGPTSGSGVANGFWTSGSEIAIDLNVAPAPYSWLQLLGKGVVIDVPGTICHPFEGGRYGWTADIRQLVDGAWIKTPTSQGWSSGEESVYQACAVAPAAGTYALFAYYTRPDDGTKKKETCAYDTSEWTFDFDWDVESGLTFKVNLQSDFPAGVAASYEILSSDGYTNPISETTYTWHGTDPEETYAYFANEKTYDTPFTITLRFTTSGCTKDFNLTYNPK